MGAQSRGSGITIRSGLHINIIVVLIVIQDSQTARRKGVVWFFFRLLIIEKEVREFCRDIAHDRYSGSRADKKEIKMDRYRHKYRTWIRAIAMAVVCLFTINTLVWAYPDMATRSSGTNLQVPSFFGSNDRQIRTELACIMAMSMTEKPFQDINAELDEWLSAVTGADTNRMLNVLSNPVVVEEGIEIIMEVFRGPDAGKRFRVIADPDSIENINDPVGAVRIEEIDREGRSRIVADKRSDEKQEKEEIQLEDDGTSPSVLEKDKDKDEKPANSILTNRFDSPFWRALNIGQTVFHELGHLLTAVITGQWNKLFDFYKRKAAMDLARRAVDVLGIKDPQEIEELMENAAGEGASTKSAVSKARKELLQDVLWQGRVIGVSGFAGGFGGMLGNIIGLGFAVAMVPASFSLAAMPGIYSFLALLPDAIALFIILALPAYTGFMNLISLGNELIKAFTEGDIYEYIDERKDITALETQSELDGYAADLHEIGKKMGKFGHSIDRGKSTGRRGEDTREKIIVDFSKDKALRVFYSRFMVRFCLKILKEAGPRILIEVIMTRITGRKRRLQLPPRLRGGLVRIVYDTVKEMVAYDLGYVVHELESRYRGKWVLIGDAAIKPGKGVCRHHGLIVSAVLERLIQDGYLHGWVFYRRDRGHGWAEYRDSARVYHKVDVAGREFIPNYYEVAPDEEEEAMTGEEVFAHTMVVNEGFAERIRGRMSHEGDSIEDLDDPDDEEFLPDAADDAVDIDARAFLDRQVRRYGFMDNGYQEIPEGMGHRTIKGDSLDMQSFEGDIWIKILTRSYRVSVVAGQVWIRAYDNHNKAVVGDIGKFDIGRTITVGRTRTNDYADIWSGNEHVSRKHFSLVVSDRSGGYEFGLTDLNSLCGTEVAWKNSAALEDKSETETLDGLNEGNGKTLPEKTANGLFGEKQITDVRVMLPVLEGLQFPKGERYRKPGDDGDRTLRNVVENPPYDDYRMPVFNERYTKAVQDEQYAVTRAGLEGEISIEDAIDTYFPDDGDKLRKVLKERGPKRCIVAMVETLWKNRAAIDGYVPRSLLHHAESEWNIIRNLIAGETGFTGGLVNIHIDAERTLAQYEKYFGDEFRSLSGNVEAQNFMAHMLLLHDLGKNSLGETGHERRSEAILENVFKGDYCGLSDADKNMLKRVIGFHTNVQNINVSEKNKQEFRRLVEETAADGISIEKFGEIIKIWFVFRMAERLQSEHFGFGEEGETKELRKGYDAVKDIVEKVYEDRGSEQRSEGNRTIEKLIVHSDKKSQQVMRTVTAYLEGAAGMTESNKEVTPIDIEIDLSMMPQGDIDSNVETWAYLFLMCKDIKNVNFVFKLPELSKKLPGASQDKYEEKLTIRLLEDVNKAAGEQDFVARLKKSILGKAMAAGMTEEYLDERINAEREGALKMSIMSKSWLEWMRLRGLELDKGQYPVAMAGNTIDTSGAVALRNFEAAVTIGLAKAALAIAKKRDEENGEGQKELPQLRKQMLGRLQKLYEIICGDRITLTEDTLDNMVHSYSAVRLCLAISMALPPITRDVVEKLENHHENIQLALMAA